MSFISAKIAKITNIPDIAPANIQPARPVLILTINNGAGHTQAAKAIAEAWREINSKVPARVVEVSDFMSRKARFTHVSAYLWLVKNVPVVWDKIDSYQKRQTKTSPTWFYRRECRKLFNLTNEIEPVALVATEVGCGEIAALIKRDLGLKIPLVAVNVNYDADRAWIQPETDFYCLATDTVLKNFENLGARREQIAAWGVPMQPGFFVPGVLERTLARHNISHLLGLNENDPLVVVAGGSEGIGKIEQIISLLLKQIKNPTPQIVVLTGRNQKLKKKCEAIAKITDNANRLFVLGWTNLVPELFRAADVLTSKLGNTFDEAMACALPMVALPPPPGSEQEQYKLLEKWGTGRAVRTVEQAVQTIEQLLKNPNKLAQMRKNAAFFGQANAAGKLARWLALEIEKKR